MFDDNFTPLSPINFFEVGFKVQNIPHKTWKEEITLKNYLLSDTGWLMGEKHHFRLHMGWSEKGLYFFVRVEGKFDQPSYPDLTEGDSLELFIDTRNRKDSGFNTKFCHHFFFLPKSVEEHQKGEITRFRTEDAHPLSDADDITMESEGTTKGGKFKIFLPASVLVGWNPSEFPQVGFSCRLNRHFSEPEHISAKTQEYPIEQDPSLWASCKLEG